MKVIKWLPVSCFIFILGNYQTALADSTEIDGDITASTLTVTGLVSISTLTANNISASTITTSSITITGPVSISTLTVNNKDVGSSLVPSGTILAYGGSTAPPQYLLCDGSAVGRTTYAALFNAIGTTWGAGDGSTTFNVPDLRGRTAIGEGQGSGLSNRTLGQTLGEETHQLIVSEMPSHSHTDSGHTHGITDPGHAHAGTYVKDSGSTSGYFVAGAGPVSGYGVAGSIQIRASMPSATTGISVNSGTANLTSTGGGGAHNNMQPSAVVNYIIKT